MTMQVKIMNAGTDRRQAIVSSISCILVEAGYLTVENRAVLETLAETMQSFIVQAGILGRGFADHARRAEPLLADVVLALSEMGVHLEEIPRHARRRRRYVLQPIPRERPRPEPRTLATASRPALPPHIPPHLPHFPNPHTFVRTPIQKHPDDGYAISREKAALQKRNNLNGLLQFKIRTSNTQSLFTNIKNCMFPLIACNPKFPPYRQALLPKDQAFTCEGDSQAKQGETKERQFMNMESIDNPFLKSARRVAMTKRRD